MKQIFLALLLTATLTTAAEASIKHKIKAIVLCPIRCVTCSLGGAIVGIGAALLSTMWTWDGEPPL